MQTQTRQEGNDFPELKVMVVPVTRDNLDLVVKAGVKFGMPRSKRWFLRCMFDPTLDDLIQDDCRGHMAVRCDGEVVAIQCYYYIPVFFHQQKLIMSTGCVMGADSKYGEYLICCLDNNKVRQNEGSIGIGNCIASKRSARICKVFHKLREAPPEARQLYRGVADWSLYPIHVLRKNLRLPLPILKATWYMTRPVSQLHRACIRLAERISGYKVVQYCKIDIEKFSGFWREYLAENDGLITSREPARLSWLFNDSLAAGTVKIIAAEQNGEIKGYALIRRYHREEGFFNNHSLYDICALHNDVTVIKLLVRAAKRLAGDDRGLLMMYVGALPNQDKWLSPYLPGCVKGDHSMIFYGSRNKEIMQSIEERRGWFLGPMDGERSLGHGAFIDL